MNFEKIGHEPTLARGASGALRVHSIQTSHLCSVNSSRSIALLHQRLDMNRRTFLHGPDRN
jgi:hypothetical protein